MSNLNCNNEPPNYEIINFMATSDHCAHCNEEEFALDAEIQHCIEQQLDLEVVNQCHIDEQIFVEAENQHWIEQQH